MKNSKKAKSTVKKSAARPRKAKKLETPDELTEKVMKEAVGKPPDEKEAAPVEVAIDPAIEDTSEVIVHIAGKGRKKMTMTAYRALMAGGK